MHRTTQDALFQRRLPDPVEDYDRLSGQQAPEEEAQVAAASVFLFFVPFQILKRTRRHSREIIYIALKAKSPRQSASATNGLSFIVNSLVSKAFPLRFLRRFLLPFFLVNVHHSVGRG